MIPISSSLDDFIGKEVFVESVHGLLRSIVPTYVDHRLSVRAAVCSVDLSRDRLGEIVGVSYVHPVADLVQFAVMQDAVRYGYLSLVVRKVRIRFGLFYVVQTAGFDLQSDCVFENLLIVCVVLLRVVEHDVHVGHEFLETLVLFALDLALKYVVGHWVLDLHVVFGHCELVW